MSAEGAVGTDASMHADIASGAPGRVGVFHGIKVWDAAWVGVGPLTSGYLANYGATVVHTETSRFPDVLRLAPPFRDGVPGINRSQFFADYNPSKMGVGLNFLTDEGKALGLRLASWADVVVESFSPGVMASFGLDYSVLRERNPGLIMLSTSMNGQSGPRMKFAGFGTVMAAMAGFCEVTGWPDRNPGSPYGAYTDFVCQRFTATSLMAALDHRRRTGVGQHIDLAQYEASLQMLAPSFLDYEVNKRVASRDGNRSPHAAPHGVYPCAPEGPRERWIAIAVETDEQWAHFRATVAEAWADDPRFATLHGRKQNEDDLDALVAAWTARNTRGGIFESLQPIVPAGPVQDAQDLQDDPQIAHRNYFRELEHPEMGPSLYEGPQAELSRTPPVLSKAAPCLGEDTRFVLSEYLGLSDQEIDQLIADGAVEAYQPSAD
jgi:crotonobetainyl-CoA:carnitine CoA-transferase CaiB-like acyl-CoA transferase